MNRMKPLVFQHASPFTPRGVTHSAPRWRRSYPRWLTRLSGSRVPARSTTRGAALIEGILSCLLDVAANIYAALCCSAVVWRLFYTHVIKDAWKFHFSTGLFRRDEHCCRAGFLPSRPLPVAPIGDEGRGAVPTGAAGLQRTPSVGNRLRLGTGKTRHRRCPTGARRSANRTGSASITREPGGTAARSFCCTD